MANIVTRAGKGAALTFSEVDANFNNLNAEIGSVGATVQAATSNSVPGRLVVRDANGNFSAAKITANLEGTASDIADNVVTNAKVASNAAIAGTKIAPNFGSQNIVTGGTANIAGIAYPATDGTAGQALITNGSGVTAFAEIVPGNNTVTTEKIAPGAVATADLADNALAATPEGLGKIADGFFAATSAALAKFADGFLAATTTGRAKMADGFVTPAKIAQPLTLGTAKAFNWNGLTTNTSLDFTGIPSWVRRITVMFNGVSTDGDSIVQIQVGSGSVVTTGYRSTASYSSASPANYTYATTGFIVDTSGTAVLSSLIRSGIYTLTLLGSNTWTGGGNIGGDVSVGLVTVATAGNSPALSGALDRIRITTVNGTDAFDAGSVNILYE